MPKNIILCSDGTGNAGGKGRGTNVWRLFLSIDQHSAKTKQLAFYDDGVGTSSVAVMKAIGGATGFGLGRNIRQLYTDLAKNYEKGDKIYVFGFSRGAFTVRSLAGMIAAVGVPDVGSMSDEELEKEVKRAYRAYRSLFDSAIPKFNRACEKRDIALNYPRIHCVGVWDTVGAVGVPFREWREWVQHRLRLRPHDHDPDDTIDNAFHALAIDEERRAFTPILFDEGKAAGRGNVEQVWFAGVHSNVGGGYPKKGMANVPLHWMMMRAEKYGLKFKTDAVEDSRLAANVHSELYDSRKGPGVYYRYGPRKIDALCQAASIEEPKIHVTAVERMDRSTKSYGPVNLPNTFDVVGTDPNTCQEERDSLDKLEPLVKGCKKALIESKAATRGLIRARRVLYCGLVALTLFVLSILAAHQVDANGPPFSIFVDMSEGLQPLLGWIHWAPDGTAWLLEETAEFLLPDFLAAPLRSLFAIPKLTALLVIIGLAMAYRRKKVVGRLRHAGVGTWRGILHPGAPPLPEEIGEAGAVEETESELDSNKLGRGGEEAG